MSTDRCPSLLLSDLEQTVEERPVASERDAQVLRRGFLALVPALLETGAGLVEAAHQLGHEVGHELVGPLHRLARLVDEARLHLFPPRAEALELVAAEELLLI